MEQTGVQHRGILRERLSEGAPILYDAFKRSWDIAQEGWLQAIGTHHGSINSYSHLRNIENHLDKVVEEFEGLPNTTFKERLNGFELYMLLSAVLFHDFGQTQGQTKDHASLVAMVLPEKYGHLGILSWEIARFLAKICEYHDPSSKNPRSKLEKELHTTVIDPHGRVRGAFLAALLTLADHMDGAFTRTLPYYVAEADDIDAIGWFRREIRGVYVNANARLVRTVLGTDTDETGQEIEANAKVDKKRQETKREVRRNTGEVKKWKELEKALPGDLVNKWRKADSFHGDGRLDVVNDQLKEMFNLTL